ncbi:PhoP/PhoQ regulator MgrB [Xenorhabdus khoisanae]|uniref:PhoP/PhoQ regulator MgrB n=1 Tax=Xenorhabdus khoisanae TaxID=880157 RepID=UPI0009080A57|nr:PhoP/PhoQ regulator MgrB [Xenorhabdus khoisanae]
MKVIVLILCLILVCLFLYLLALDVHCEQGTVHGVQDHGHGQFELGICSITRYLPF